MFLIGVLLPSPSSFFSSTLYKYLAKEKTSIVILFFLVSRIFFMSSVLYSLMILNSSFVSMVIRLFFFIYYWIRSSMGLVLVFSLFLSFIALFLLLLISSCSSFTVDRTLISCYRFMVSLPLRSSGLKLMLNR